MTKKRDRVEMAERQHKLMEEQGTVGQKSWGWRNKRRPIVKGKNKRKVKS